MRQVTGILTFAPARPGMHEITHEIAEWVAAQEVASGLLTALCQHTSASVTIQENIDADVLHDLDDAIDGLAPQGGPERYRHHAEGTDDMSAHIRTVISGVNLAVPVIEGRLALGRYQGIFLWEHRNPARSRSIALHLLAD